MGLLKKPLNIQTEQRKFVHPWISLTLLFGLMSVILVQNWANLAFAILFNMANVYTLHSVTALNKQTSMKALEYYARAIEFQPETHGRAMYLRGIAYSLTNNTESMLQAWHKSPDAHYWLVLRGRTEIGRQQYNTSLSILQNALLAFPHSGTLHYYTGLAFHYLGSWEDALHEYSVAANSSFDKNFIDAHVDLQIPRVWPGIPMHYTLSPTQAHAYMQMASIYYRQQQWAQARDAAQSAIHADPINPLGHFQLGVAYFQLGLATPPSQEHEQKQLFQLAEESLSIAAKSVTNNQYMVFYNLGRLYWAQGRQEEAIEWFDRTRQSTPDISLLYAIGSLYHDAGLYDMAITIFSEMLPRTPKESQFSDYYLRASDSYWSVGQHENACNLYQLGMKLCNDNCTLDNQALVNTCTVDHR